MYLLENHHEGIVDRQTFDAVQAEMARRNAAKSPSKKNASTGKSSYASKYALSERLVCGECGTLYRLCTWTAQGRKRIVWRCVSRLDYGKKYCHNSPTVYKEPLQTALLAAVNRAMRRKSQLIIEEQRKNDQAAFSRLSVAAAALEEMSPAVTAWDESMIRQLIDTAKVLPADRIKVYFHGGIEIKQDMVQ